MALFSALTSDHYYDFIVFNSSLSSIPTDSYRIPLDETYSLLLLPASGEDSLFSFGNYHSVPKLFMLQDPTSLEVSGILQVQNLSSLSLTGSDILIGFIDTGINYNSPVFTDAAGHTRIMAIWDQTLASDASPSLFPYGREFLKKEIDEALLLDDPYARVPTRDTNGHGTSLAAIAAGSSLPDQDFTGAAPKASLAVVKLKEAKDYLKHFYHFSGTDPVYQETDLMTAAIYLQDLARRLSLPLVICLGLGSNQGEHAGNMPLEICLSDIGRQLNHVIVAAAGNEGNRAHHYFSSLRPDESYHTTELLVPENTDGFTLELWAQSPEIFSVGFVSPGGEIIPRIPPGLNSTTLVELVLESTQIQIHYETLQTAAGGELIFLRFTDPTPGLWQIRIYGSRLLSGSFHLWLPVHGFTRPDIVFLTPDPHITITAPSSAPGILSLGAYDAYTNSLYLHSGRGNNKDGIPKPDLCAPGVDVATLGIREYPTALTGTSASAAITAGAAALILEWGQHQKQTYLFNTIDVRNILIRGALRELDLSYPSREWGYGKLNVYRSFTSLINQ